MNRIKPFLLPIIVVIIIVTTLAFRLSSCSVQRNGAKSPSLSATPESSSETAPNHTTPSSPLFSMKDEDIRKVFTDNGFEVKSIRHTESAALVEFYFPKCSGLVPSRFAWVDVKTGAYDIVSDGLLSDRSELTNTNTLLVLTTGRDFVTNKQWFPTIFSSVYTADQASPFGIRYKNAMEPYYMPIDKSFTVGEDQHRSLDSLCFDFDVISVGFGPHPGFEQEFSTAHAAIPKTGVAVSGGICYITFYNTVLSPDFNAPKNGIGDRLRQFASITSDGTNTILTLKLGEKANRYNINTKSSPDDGTPYAVISFRSNDSVSYPSGW